MNQKDYDRLEAKARREYDDGVRLLRAALDTKLSAVKVLRMIPQPGPAAGGGAAENKVRAGRLQHAFDGVYVSLPEEFDKSVVFDALRRHAPELEIDQRAVSALLLRLAARDPRVEIKHPGAGRAATVYAKGPIEEREPHDDDGLLSF